MSKKVYLMAVNWQTLNQDNANELEAGVWRFDVAENNDIAHIMERFKYSEGWRVYVFTTKKARDEIASRTSKTLERS